MTDQAVQAVNAAIAENYDTVVYDPEANPVLDVARVCGMASIFGSVNYPVDVLDLGCGTGAQLARVATQVRGRLVGADISAEACRRAMERLAPEGDRARIICGDLLELKAEDLGQFDMIYNIGVIYVTPPEVQRHILDLIGQCLRPRGVAIFTYFAGSLPSLRANLHQTLRAACSGLDPASAIAHARQQLAELAKAMEQLPDKDMLRTAIADTARQSDLDFFHEVLNNAFEPLRTTAMASALSRHGLSFGSYYPAQETGYGASPVERAMAADVADFTQGDYRRAIFAKYEEPTVDGFLDRPVLWESSLRRPNPGEFEGQQVFVLDGTDIEVKTDDPAAMAMLDCLMEGPMAWLELLGRVAETLKLAGREMSQEPRQAMETDLRELWRHGLVSPLLNPPG